MPRKFANSVAIGSAGLIGTLSRAAGREPAFQSAMQLVIYGLGLMLLISGGIKLVTLGYNNLISVVGGVGTKIAPFPNALELYISLLDLANQPYQWAYSHWQGALYLLVAVPMILLGEMVVVVFFGALLYGALGPLRAAYLLAAPVLYALLAKMFVMLSLWFVPAVPVSDGAHAPLSAMVSLHNALAVVLPALMAKLPYDAGVWLSAMLLAILILMPVAWHFRSVRLLLVTAAALGLLFAANAAARWEINHQLRALGWPQPLITQVIKDAAQSADAVDVGYLEILGQDEAKRRGDYQGHWSAWKASGMTAEEARNWRWLTTVSLSQAKSLHNAGVTPQNLAAHFRFPELGLRPGAPPQGSTKVPFNFQDFNRALAIHDTIAGIKVDPKRIRQFRHLRGPSWSLEERMSSPRSSSELGPGALQCLMAMSEVMGIDSTSMDLMAQRIADKKREPTIQTMSVVFLADYGPSHEAWADDQAKRVRSWWDYSGQCVTYASYPKSVFADIVKARASQLPE